MLHMEMRTGRVVLLHPIAGGDIGSEPLGEWREPERYFERAAREVSLA